MYKYLYHVFCADCKQKYTQKAFKLEEKPTKCGACGSTWIAVKDEMENV